MATLTLSRSHDLRETNSRLRTWLEGMDMNAGNTACHVTPADISALLSELVHAGAGLRAEPIPPEGIDPELDEELAEYRKNVEHLRDRMPAIHRQLLAERARLETQRTRVQLAVEWAQASRQTL